MDDQAKTDEELREQETREVGFTYASVETQAGEQDIVLPFSVKVF